MIRAIELPLWPGTSISKVTGTIYVTRDGNIIGDPLLGIQIRSGDLLQVPAGSSVSLRHLNGRETSFGSVHDEWFKFVAADRELPAGPRDPEQILRTAKVWRKDENIPVALSHYWKSPSDLPDPLDSDALISRVDNLLLLATIATDLSADAECRELALTQGMYVGGPSVFFGLVTSQLDATSGAQDPWLSQLHARTEKTHVAVDAMFIEDADFPAQRMTQLLDRIEHELSVGTDWNSVYRKYAEAFGHRTGHMTKIGNGGRLVVFPDPALGRGHFIRIGGHAIQWQGEELPLRLARLDYFDASHLQPILQSEAGATIRVHSEIYHEWWLYRVEEVYRGTDSPGR